MLMAWSGQGAAGVVGEDLHVAGQHHQVDGQLVDQCEQPGLGIRLGVARDGDVMERHVVGSRIRSRSRWFPTTAGTTMFSAPRLGRNSRSLRQCPDLDTITRARYGVSARNGCQSIAYAVAADPNSATACTIPGRSGQTTVRTYSAFATSGDGSDIGCCSTVAA